MFGKAIEQVQRLGTGVVVLITAVLGWQESAAASTACPEGGAVLQVINQIPARAYIEVEREGTYGRELLPGEQMRLGLCNRDQVVVRVYSSRRCGQQLIGQLEALQVEGERIITLRPQGIAEQYCPDEDLA